MEQICAVAAREEEGGGEGDTGGGEWGVEEVLGQGVGGVTSDHLDGGGRKPYKPVLAPEPQMINNKCCFCIC